MTLMNADALDKLSRPQVGAQRLLIALLQGAALYGLYRAAVDQLWPSTVPTLFVPLVLVAILCPIVAIVSLGHLAPRRLALWVGSVVAVVALLGWYDGWRGGEEMIRAARAQSPSPQLFIHLLVALFIGHTLLAAASAEARRISSFASYAGYFDGAWKLAVQLVFSAAFVGATWLVLTLGSGLFKLIGLDFLEQAIGKSWFVIPVTVFAFACAIHITDVRPAIVRGIRGLILVLMGWLLPVVTVLVAGFLLSMPFTGLAPLWSTRHAAATLLGAAALLVIMINAAWQQGDVLAAAPAPLRWSARLAAVLLTPLVLIAALALRLRVRDHGWTDDRVIACACLAVAACYALGYLLAALRSPRLARLGEVNIGTAFVVVALTLALFSPLLDPARIAVNSQLARLAAGTVAADKFDYAYLRFGGRRYGREALARLQTQASGPQAAAIRAGAGAALALQHRYPQARGETRLDAAALRANLTVWPAGASLPADFYTRLDLAPQTYITPGCLVRSAHCDAFMIDFGGSGKPDILLVSKDDFGGSPILHQDGDGAWRVHATLPLSGKHCGKLRERLVAGGFKLVTPASKALEIDGQLLQPVPVQQPGVPVCPP